MPGRTVRALLVAVVCASVASCSNRNTSGESATLRRITIESGYDGYPAVAGDGQAIVFSSDRTGAFELYVTRTDQSRDVRAITSDRGQNVEADWSPDGAWIAYHSRARGGVWIVGASGGAPRKVRDTGSQPAWSPRGDRLAFTDAAPGEVADATVVWTIRTDGTDARPLTAIGSPPGAHHHPAYSNDGRHVAFAAGGDAGPSIFVISAQGGASVNVASGRAASHPRFAPHDDVLFWTGADEQGRPRVSRTPVERGRGAPIGFPEVAATFDAASTIDAMSIDREGVAAIGLVSESAHLWAIDIAPDGAVSVPIQLTDAPGRDAAPAMAAGDRVAFTRQVLNDKPSPWTMNADGSDERPARDEDRGARALLSPSADRVRVVTRDGVHNLMSVAARPGGHDDRMLTSFTSPGDAIGQALWLPSRPRVIFDRVVRRSSVWTVVLQRP